MKTKKVHVVVILSLWIIQKEWCDKVTFSVKSKMAWEFGVYIFGVGILVCSGAKGLFCGFVRVYVWLYVCLFVCPFFCACVFLCENMYVFFVQMFVYMYLHMDKQVFFTCVYVCPCALVYLYLCCVSVYECVGGKVGDMYWYIYLRGSECLTSLTCNVFLPTCVRISMYSNSEHVRVGQAYINHYLLNVSLRVTSLPVLTLALYTFQCQINPALRPWHRKVVNV